MCSICFDTVSTCLGHVARLFTNYRNLWSFRLWVYKRDQYEQLSSHTVGVNVRKVRETLNTKRWSEERYRIVGLLVGWLAISTMSLSKSKEIALFYRSTVCPFQLCLPHMQLKLQISDHLNHGAPSVPVLPILSFLLSRVFFFLYMFYASFLALFACPLHYKTVSL